MKLFTIATALLGATQATQSEESLEAKTTVNAQSQIEFKQELKIQGLISDALKNGGTPYTITVPAKTATDHEGEEKLAVPSKAPNYRFDWKYVCAFTKWTPSNQFVNAGKKYESKSMTLARFGFVGTDKSCFWGMTGVHWITPLKVDQILSKEPKVVKKSATKSVKNVAMTTSLGERRMHLEDERTKTIGFTGKEIDGQQVLQNELTGQHGDIFNLEKINKGSYKGMFVFRNVMLNTLLSVFDNTYKAHQWLTESTQTFADTQVWKLMTTDGETTIADPTGKWCLTRFTEAEEKGAGAALQLQSTAKTAPVYTSDVQLMPCNMSAEQYWFLSNKSIQK